MFKSIVPLLLLNIVTAGMSMAVAADKPTTSGAVATIGNAPGRTNDWCMKCHGSHLISGKGGRKVFIDPEVFKATAHADVGCTSCHDAVSARHPGDDTPMGKVNCAKCHEQTALDYAKTKHGDMATCIDCHNPHAVKTAAVTSADQMNAKCAKCHDNTKLVAKHSEWLPQTPLHLNFVPCVTCHTGSKDYVITLFVGKKSLDKVHEQFVPLTYSQFNERSIRGRPAKKLLDQNNDGTLSLDELRYFNRNSETGGAGSGPDAGHGMWLYGVMMPEQVSHSFQILTNRLNCTFCHATGPDAHQTSYVALPLANGRFERLPVQKGAVLDILYGTPDFYMVGATRSLPLSILAGLIILGGATFPAVHGTFRFLTRKNRQKGNKEH